MRPLAAVLDASIAAPWFLPDEANAASDEVYASMRRGVLTFHAPELWPWECGNIIVSAVKQRRMLAADASIAWSTVDAARGFLVVAEPQASHVVEAIGLSIAHGLSIYDAAYLRLALQHGLPLCTADRALARAAESAGVHTLGLKDLA